MLNKLGRLMSLPRVDLAHKPTPLEAMTNMSAHFGDIQLYVKRDDCTGLAFGGNKARQLEFYLGEAVSQGADTVLITGAVQSNFVRLAAAAACKLGLACHIQLEDRVGGVDEVYRNSGNVLLCRMLGARLHYYDKGDDESGADQRIREIASELEKQGQRPYIIPLAPGHAPLGALGYVLAAKEILGQIEVADLDIDEIIVASGSGHTHAGLLFGLKALGGSATVTGICVRREAVVQRERIRNRCVEISRLLDIDSPVTDADINLIDDFLPPGYGRINAPALEAIELAAQLEGLFVDPTYTAKSMAGFIHRARQVAHTGAARLLFIHTGGQPAIFGSEPKLTEYFKQA